MVSPHQDFKVSWFLWFKLGESPAACLGPNGLPNTWPVFLGEGLYIFLIPALAKPPLLLLLQELGREREGQ